MEKNNLPKSEMHLNESILMLIIETDCVFLIFFLFQRIPSLSGCFPRPKMFSVQKNRHFDIPKRIYICESLDLIFTWANVHKPCNCIFSKYKKKLSWGSLTWKPHNRIRTLQHLFSMWRKQPTRGTSKWLSPQNQDALLNSDTVKWILGNNIYASWNVRF